jgi:hypothetical protein
LIFAVVAPRLALAEFMHRKGVPAIPGHETAGCPAAQVIGLHEVGLHPFLLKPGNFLYDFDCRLDLAIGISAKFSNS